ncbi:MAG: hypothetical protein AB7I35_18045 [Ramlibacter sp.]
MLYLSGYLKQHQAEYYRRLSAIRTGALMEELGVVKELTGQRTNRIYCYQGYVELLPG